jgi:hypothetical protein
MDGFSGKFSKEELQGLRDSWYQNNKQFHAQDCASEFETPDRASKPSMTFKEIAEVEGITAPMVYKVFKRAMKKLENNLSILGVDKELCAPNFDNEICFKAPDGIFRTYLNLD